MTEILSSVMNGVADGIFTLDQTGIVQTANRAAERIFGYSREEFIGRKFNSLMPERYFYHFHSVEDKTLKVEHEVEIERKDGFIFPVKLSISEMSMPSGQMFLAIIEDIAELKTIALDLQAAAARYGAIVENTVDGIVNIDERGNIETFNRACENIFGYTAAEVLGQNVKILMPEPYYSEHDTYLKNYSDTGHRKIIGIGREVQGKRKDGTIFPIDLAISEVKLGKKPNFTGIIRDITDRKKAEAIQQKLITKMAESNEDLEHFAYICSHDLQEPLRMVRSYTQKMEMYFADKNLEARPQKYMKYIVEGAFHAQNLINEILSYSRMDFESKQETVDLQKIIGIANHNIRTLIEDKGASISLLTLPKITGNRVLMIQLFQNLISNAIKYCKQKPQITIRSKDAGEYWQISVQDNGIGIAPEYYNKVFLIFERLHSRFEYGGTGLGLAICKKIVERHGGKIWVNSEVGSGSTFFLTLPKSKNE